MEKQNGTAKDAITFLLGGAVGMGAGLLLHKACVGRCGAGKPVQEKGSRDGQKSDTYCAVPEGADICFPD